MTPPKALIIGIDGLPFELLIEMVERGCMERLRAILASGYRIRRMKASLPDVSSVSWTSFMTGVNPGEHGIFGFTHLRPNSYALSFPSSRDIMAPTFWQTLNRKRKIEGAIILNVPNTYPAVPTKGLLVSGFTAVDFDKAVYPPSYIPFLRQMNYIIDVDTGKAREDKEAFYRDLRESLSIRGTVALELMKREHWDLFLLCISETDRLHHFFFDTKDSQLFSVFYEQVDKVITSLYEAAREKIRGDFLFMIVSDHGFASLRKEVNLNAYLAEAGFLSINDSGEYYERVSQETSAFAMDPGRIYIHYEHKFPLGHIRQYEGEALKKKLKEALFDLKDPDGGRVIRHIFAKEEIYSGRFMAFAPDLVCVPNDGFNLKGNMTERDVFTTDILTGMHTWDNATLVVPNSVKTEKGISIEVPSKIITDYFEGQL